MAAKSAVKPIPEGFHTVTPYLIVEQANRLIDFLTQGLGAEEVSRTQGPDGTISNAEVRISDSMLELADRTEQWKPRRGAIHLYVPDADAIYQRAMAAGGVSLEVPTDQSYGDREAGVKDPSGNQWWIATHKAAGPGNYVPAGLRSITAYLHVKGAAQMMEFLKRAFEAQEESCAKSPEGVVQHAKMQIGDSMVELSDAHGEFQPLTSAIHLYVPDTDAVYGRALGAGASSLIQPANQFYGDRAAGILDPFGIHWYIATRIDELSPEEIRSRAP